VSKKIHVLVSLVMACTDNLKTNENAGSEGGECEDVLRGVAMCSFVEIDRRFGYAYCLRNQCDAGGNEHLLSVG
jgi:hypothetical protein